MKTDQWVAQQIRDNENRIAELKAEREELKAEQTEPPILAEVRAAHEEAQADRNRGTIYYRAYVLGQALEQGYSKHYLSKFLGVSSATIYHYIDPGYRDKPKGPPAHLRAPQE